MTLFSREGCHLCAEAHAGIERLRARAPFDLRTIDIAGNPTLELAYGKEIPVVAVDGVPVCRGKLDEAALLARLEGAAP